MTRTRRVCLALLLAALSLQPALATPSTLHIGVLAIDEPDVQASREAALDEYLTRTLGDVDVEVRHYGFEEMQQAILGRTVDLALTSSTDYVAYAHRIGLSANESGSRANRARSSLNATRRPGHPRSRASFGESTSMRATSMPPRCKQIAVKAPSTSSSLTR